MNDWRFIFLFVAVGYLTSCANRAGGPTGGPRDSIPPVVVRSVPLEATVNFRKREIQVFFNENINLERVQENVFISPLQIEQPIIRASGRQLSVVLQDELIDNTTYSLFFGNAVVDLNENNPLKGFSFSFSTGPVMDTLQVSGRLIDAQNLNPLNNIIVGLQRDLSDSALLLSPFVRATKTDENGHFTIRNIGEGTYRLYALRDQNRDFLYQPGEGVAFHDSLIVPWVQVHEVRDTLEADTALGEHIHLHRTNEYYPQNKLLSLFTESKRRQFLRQSERPEKFRFNLIFNDRLSQIPDIRFLEGDAQKPLLYQFTTNADTLMCWIRDEHLIQRDTLKLSVTYLKTDSVFNLVTTTDTVRLTVRRTPPATRGAAAPPPARAPANTLSIQTNIANTMEFHRNILVSSEQPVDTVALSAIALSQMKDTLRQPVVFRWEPLDTIGRQFAIRYSFKPKQQYELLIDSAALVSIYGFPNVRYRKIFTTNAPEDYATLQLKLVHPNDSLVLQVLDPKEVVVQSQIVKTNGNTFEHLPPGDYFVRLIVDSNKNGVWDTGDLVRRMQPEKVIYFSKKLSLKANWEVEERWDHTDKNNWFRKPDELKPATPSATPTARATR